MLKYKKQRTKELATYSAREPAREGIHSQAMAIEILFSRHGLEGLGAE
jgi:hypothetical protein